MIAPIVFAAAASAAGVSLDVDTHEIREGQTIALQIVVTDASVRGVPTLRVPDGLELQYQGQSQARTILNFESTTTTTFRYALTALRRGSYTLGPYDVGSSSGRLRSSPVTLEVGARASGGSSDQLVSELGAERVWVGQTVVMRARFQTDKALVQARWSPPTADAFTPEDGIEPQVSERRVSEDGKPVSVQELLVALHARREGKHAVPGPILQAQFVVARSRGADPLFDALSRFGDVRGEVYAAETRSVEVHPLPSVGRPPDFSGLVGRFVVTAEPSTTTLAVGETLTLDVLLSGDGALTGFTLPAISLDGFRIYDDQPAVSAAFVDGDYRAEARLKRALVAQAPGTYTIPPVSVATFDPGSGTWATIASEPIPVTVTGSVASPAVTSYAGPASISGTVETLAEDILPVRTEASVRAPSSPWWSLTLLVPGALLLLVEVVRAWRTRPQRAAATRDFGVADLPSDPEARVAAWERLLRERAGARLGIAPDALRREDLAGLGALAGRAEVAWRALEGARYGGGAPLAEADLRAVVEGLT